MNRAVAPVIEGHVSDRPLELDAPIDAESQVSACRLWFARIDHPYDHHGRRISNQRGDYDRFERPSRGSTPFSHI
jgi:hypothetical protein